MLEILVFAILSVYLFYRLWSVLGTRTGNEKQRQWRDSEKNVVDKAVVLPKKNSSNIIDIEFQEQAVPSKFAEQEKILKSHFSDFSLSRFEKGARNTFTMIVKGFSEGNLKKIFGFVNEKIYQGFEKAIKAREKSGKTLSIEIKSVESEIVNVSVNKQDAKIEVRFTSDQIITTANKHGEIIENAEKLTNRMIDIWTFAKSFNTKGPAWLLIKTETYQ